MDKILSISIPSYNIEQYIDECISSFIDERIIDKIEVIIVNDGSKDSTLSKANEWKAKYPESIVVIDKENGGHGSTINAAIKVAKGKYFKNVDGDDWVDTEEFVKFVNKLENIDVDLVLTDYNKVYQESKTIKSYSMKEVHNYPEEEVFPVEYMFNLKSFQAMHTITYRTRILKDNNIRLSEKCFYVDIQFNIFPMQYVKTAYYMPLNVYQYRLEREGQSVSVEGYIKHFDDHPVVFRTVADLYRDITDPDYKKYVLNYIEGLIKTEVNILNNPKVYRDTKFYKAKRKDLINILKTIDGKNILKNMDRVYRYTLSWGVVLGVVIVPRLLEIRNRNEN